ncbi:MAG: helix-turn-helix domain-containing protein [Pseudomonadota bacterium]
MSRGPVDPLNSHIGSRLRELRTTREWSLQRTAELIQVSQQQLSRFEQGHNRLGAAQLYRLACGLGVPVGWFFKGYREAPEEQGRQANVVREPMAEIPYALTDDEAEQLLSYWRSMGDPEVRRRILELLETLSLNRG